MLTLLGLRYKNCEGVLFERVNNMVIMRMYYLFIPFEDTTSTSSWLTNLQLLDIVIEELQLLEQGKKGEFREESIHINIIIERDRG